MPSACVFLLLTLLAAYRRFAVSVFFIPPVSFLSVCPALLGKVMSCLWYLDGSVFCPIAFPPSFSGYSNGTPFKQTPETLCNQLLEHHDHTVTSSYWHTNILEKFKPLPDWLGGIIVHAFKTVKHVVRWLVQSHNLSNSEDPDPLCLRPCHFLHMVALLSHMGSANGLFHLHTVVAFSGEQFINWPELHRATFTCGITVAYLDNLLTLSLFMLKILDND